MTAHSANATDGTAGRATIDIVNVRLFDATPTQLFEAFSDPEQLAKWWGPAGFTNTIEEFDFRPGGAWRITMHAPNGADFANESQIVEFVKPTRIVFDHLGPMHWYRMTMTYQAVGEQTELTWLMKLEASPESEKLREFIEQANEQNFDRLAAHVAGVTAPGFARG
ncbi:SRPBCC family protein [Lacipirellula sp.]|uniref:SRPBCC family protein n=1 Tax=Lacipirellula sp. TaxID=2691419 RepID=UPI003D0EF46B